MFRRAIVSARVAKLPRWLPASQLEQQTTLPLLQARSMTVASLDLVGAEPRITCVPDHAVIKESRIVDDSVLIGDLREACTTIRKAVRSSKKVHPNLGSELLSLNQMVRWINTKEEQCNKIITLVSEYGLCDRLKPSNFKSAAVYVEALTVHHRAMQAAMKAKQSMDENDCIALEFAVEDLSKLYLKE